MSLARQFFDCFNPVDPKGFFFATDLDRLQTLKSKIPLSLSIGIGSDHYFAGLGQIAQPRSQIDSLSGNTMCSFFQVHFTSYHETCVYSRVH